MITKELGKNIGVKDRNFYNEVVDQNLLLDLING